MSEDAETPLSAGSEDPNDSIERIGRKKRRLDYTEYSQDEEEEKMKTNGRTKKVKHIERKARPKQGTMGPSRRNRTKFTEEEIFEMWLFVIDRIRDPQTNKISKPRCGATIWRDFKREMQSTRNELSFYVHFRRSMIPALDASTFDMQTKTLIHYALEIPCTEEFLSDLREEENVEVNVNEANIITGYRKIRKNGIVEDDGWEEIWGENAIGVSVSGNESLDFSMENGGSGTEGTNSLYDEDDRNIQSS